MKPLRAGYGSYLENFAFNIYSAEERGLRPVGLLPPVLTTARLETSPLMRDFNTSACRERRYQCVYDGPNLCQRMHGWQGRFAENGKKLPKVKLMVEKADEELKLPFWECAALLGETLTPTRQLQGFLQSRMRPELPCLAVHMRFGDSCGTDSYRTGRRCEPVAHYQEAAAMMLLKYPSYKSVAVVSDSREALNSFQGNFSAYSGVPVFRSHATTVGDRIQQEKTVFEARTLSDAAEWALFLDFLADLHILASCDGLVGKFTSNVDRIALALMANRRLSVPPFVSIDQSPWCMFGFGRSKYGPFIC